MVPSFGVNGNLFQMDSHNCIRELRTLVAAAEQKSLELRKELDDCKYELAEQRRDIGVLKDVVRQLRGGATAADAMAGQDPAGGRLLPPPIAPPPQPLGAAAASVSSPSSSSLPLIPSSSGSSPSVSEIQRWCSTLPRARVTRWGGMISTPDAVLQVVKSYLDAHSRPY